MSLEYEIEFEEDPFENDVYAVTTPKRLMNSEPDHGIDKEEEST